MLALEILTLLTAIPGAVTAMGQLWTQRSILCRRLPSSRTELDISVRVIAVRVNIHRG